MKRISALLSILVLLFSGCSYGEDVDAQSFVIAVGVDKGKSFPLKVTFVFANPEGSSGGGGESDGGGGGGEEKSSSGASDIVTVEAPTTFSAVRKLDSIKSKKINLTHTKIVVLSDEIAKEGIKTFLSGFASSRDFRPNTYVCVSNGDAQKYLDSVKPSQEAFIEKYYDHIMRKFASDKVNDSYLYYLFFNVTQSFSGSLVPLVGVNKNKLDDPQIMPMEGKDDFSYEARAGEIIRDAKNKAEILGSAIMKNDKMIGTLGSFQTDLSRIICNEYYPRNYSIEYPQSPNFVTVRLFQQTSPEINTKIKNGSTIFDISIPLSIEYIDSGKIENDTIKSAEFCRYLEKRLNEETKKLIDDAQHKYESDFLGLGNYLKRHFIDVDAWENFKWEEKYKSAKINVSFKILYADFEETN